jgi:hypothetical protein
MTNEKKPKNWKMDKALHYIYINEVIFITLVSLCFVGELLAEFTDRVAMFYWFCITPVFFYCSLLSEKAKAISIGVENQHLVRYELFYWGSAMISVLLVFLMWHADMIQPGAAAMSIHIILAHTMFLTGIVLGVHYYLVGGFLFVTAVLSIMFGGEFGFDLVIAIPFIWLGFYLEKILLFPTLKRKHDFIKDTTDNNRVERRKESRE